MRKKILLRGPVLSRSGYGDQSKRSIIGKIANKYCSKIYLTDDNPRHENPKNIRNALKKKYKKKQTV